jgi:hypothetical protein
MYLEGLRKATKKLYQDNQRTVRGSNTDRAEQKSTASALRQPHRRGNLNYSIL